jgi:hypothetical protein
MNTSGAGGLYPSEACGLIVLWWRRQLSMMIWALRKRSPLAAAATSQMASISSPCRRLIDQSRASAGMTRQTRKGPRNQLN